MICCWCPGSDVANESSFQRTTTQQTTTTDGRSMRRGPAAIPMRLQNIRAVSRSINGSQRSNGSSVARPRSQATFADDINSICTLSEASPLKKNSPITGIRAKDVSASLLNRQTSDQHQQV
jgi:hypothetical protein